jgi:hypothetical protein
MPLAQQPFEGIGRPFGSRGFERDDPAPHDAT